MDLVLRNLGKEGSYSCRLSLGLTLSSPRLASLMKETLAPELNGAHQRRSHASLQINGSRLTLSVSAHDNTALKASLHYFLMQLNLITQLWEGFGNE
ncbi:MAG: hypothetical protein HY917_02280 [Candidatus Diapherotrites archaeon]|nr:hypothetical protein [Candidatus Diapherotrites archaeon]